MPDDHDTSIPALTDAASAGELTGPQVAAAADHLLGEGGEAAEKAGFLKALARRGETPAEIAAFVDAFLAVAVDPGLAPGDLDAPAIDICGTGGDKLDLFNVSTTAMFLLAGGGAAVVKHGNRGITSKSGGADVLEALGIPIDLPPAEFCESMKRHRAGFLFAPLYHPAFKAVVPVRKLLAEEGQRTVFNILGPLLNPCRPDYQLIGVFDESLPPTFAEILRRLGRESAWAVHGQAGGGLGMDELSTLGTTAVAKLKAGEITQDLVDPAALGLAPTSLEELQGGDAEVNAAILTGIIDGSDRGPRYQIAALNAAAGFVITGLAPDLEAGLARAAESVESGAAMEVLDGLRAG